MHYLDPSPVALNVTVIEETCSSVTISWTPEHNRPADFVILYKSRVHSGTVNYRPVASPSYTTKLTNLVADTDYLITVIDSSSDNIATTVIFTNTKSGTPSEIGMHSTKSTLDSTYIHGSIINQQVYCAIKI